MIKKKTLFTRLKNVKKKGKLNVFDKVIFRVKYDLISRKRLVFLFLNVF